MPADTSAWVADFGGDQVVHVLSDGTLGVAIPAASPIGLALDSATQHSGSQVLPVARSIAIGSRARPSSGSRVRPDWLGRSRSPPIRSMAACGWPISAEMRSSSSRRMDASWGGTEGDERLLDIVLDPAGGLAQRGR